MDTHYECVARVVYIYAKPSSGHVWCADSAIHSHVVYELSYTMACILISCLRVHTLHAVPLISRASVVQGYIKHA